MNERVITEEQRTRWARNRTKTWVNARLHKDWHRVLQRIAAVTRRAQSEELRIMIDKRAIELGLTPVQPVRTANDSDAGHTPVPIIGGQNETSND
jgi:hypothetical protein